MRVSLSWLADYVDISGLTPETIADALTKSGLEVESIERTGGAFSGVIVGRIDHVDPHPNADRLRLVTVTIGNAQSNRVVCGAPNVAVGQYIAYAQIGASVINRKEGGTFTLQAATIRGVESSGMICAIEELGLETQFEKPEDGIWPINDRVTESQLGQDLKQALNLLDDVVLDVMPNANRGDLMSMIGVAREVAALFCRELTLPDFQPVPAAQSQSPYVIALPEPQLCTFYAGGLLKGIQLKPSPAWMQQRLIAAGMRPINNVVDITNYVMLETGQPLHAFDIEKLGPSGTVSVIYGGPWDSITTLDGIERALKPESVVISFNNRSVALAGVMGGSQEQITDSTQHVFLEAAFFPSASTRRSARSMGLRTESSARFERGVDAAGTEQAFYRAIGLLQSLAGAQLESLSQCNHRSIVDSNVTLRAARMAKILGMTVPTEQVEAILVRLGFRIRLQPDQTWLVNIPSFRQHDVSREVDVIEEIIRIYGYNHIPYTLPQGTPAAAKTPRAQLLEKIRHTLTGAGLTEVTTLSLIGTDLLKRTGFHQDEAATVRVTNSHSLEHLFLRQSLLPTLLEVGHFNQSQGTDALWMFELGKTYFKRNAPQARQSGVDEPLMLAGILMNTPAEGIWCKPRSIDFFMLKGVLENLFQALGIHSKLRWMKESQQAVLHPGQSARLKLGKADLGFLGTLHPTLQETLKFKSPVYLFELNVEVLASVVVKKTAALPQLDLFSAYPPVKRDMAFIAPDSLTHGQIMAVLTKASEPLLKQIELFDIYTNAEQLGKNQRSLAYRLTLQSSEQTLTDAQIDYTVQKLKQCLADELSVAFR